MSASTPRAALIEGAPLSAPPSKGSHRRFLQAGPSGRWTPSRAGATVPGSPFCPATASHHHACHESNPHPAVKRTRSLRPSLSVSVRRQRCRANPRLFFRWRVVPAAPGRIARRGRSARRPLATLRAAAALGTATPRTAPSRPATAAALCHRRILRHVESCAITPASELNPHPASLIKVPAGQRSSQASTPFGLDRWARGATRHRRQPPATAVASPAAGAGPNDPPRGEACVVRRVQKDQRPPRAVERPKPKADAKGASPLR